jgi:predicted ATP-grasp superfamily ATP-dependent carboligase
MPPLRIIEQPELREPTLIAAFAGWSDAGSAATAAAQYLIDRWHAPVLAELDAEEFYDFTQLRPTVRYTEGTYRKITWPQNNFHYHQTAERDLIIFNGIEPHLKWQSYVNSVLEIIDRFHVSLFVSLGAMFVDFPHTRPMRVTGSAPTDEMATKAGIVVRGRGRYEGPTGISGVLSAALRDREMPLSSIWANVPHYVSATPNPTASLALLRSVHGMLSVEVPLGRMIRASAMFDTQLQEATSKNSEVSEYVRTLEERIDANAEDSIEEPHVEEELPEAETVVEDIEEFFRRLQGPRGEG